MPHAHISFIWHRRHITLAADVTFSLRYILFPLLYIDIICVVQSGRDSSVGIATRYGLDGLGIDLRWGKHFPHMSRPALGPTQPPIQWVPSLSRV